MFYHQLIFLKCEILFHNSVKNFIMLSIVSMRKIKTDQKQIKDNPNKVSNFNGENFNTDNSTLLIHLFFKIQSKNHCTLLCKITQRYELAVNALFTFDFLQVFLTFVILSSFYYAFIFCPYVLVIITNSKFLCLNS